MCTAISVQTPGGALFGRTMDFSYPLEPELFAVPPGYEWQNLPGTHRIRSRYRFLGIGQDISPLTFADGVNEAGFAAAVLYFPGYARYDPAEQRGAPRMSIAAIEVVKFLLGACASVEQAASVLKTVRIVGVKDSVTDSVAPLHWILTDAGGGCMVAEKTADGLHLMNDPIGVLANSPDFSWHLTNLRNYMNVSPHQNAESGWPRVTLTPFGQGGGTFGLPGDFTPPSRFVRAAYLKSHTVFPQDRDGAVGAGFHVLESVSIPKGVVQTARGASDYTQYTAFIDLSAREYFYKTYDNSQIFSAKLPSGRGGERDAVSLGKLQRPVAFC